MQQHICLPQLVGQQASTPGVTPGVLCRPRSGRSSSGAILVVVMQFLPPRVTIVAGDRPRARPSSGATVVAGDPRRARPSSVRPDRPRRSSSPDREPRLSSVRPEAATFVGVDEGRPSAATFLGPECPPAGVLPEDAPGWSRGAAERPPVRRLAAEGQRRLSSRHQNKGRGRRGDSYRPPSYRRSYASLLGRLVPTVVPTPLVPTRTRVGPAPRTDPRTRASSGDSYRLCKILQTHSAAIRRHRNSPIRTRTSSASNIMTNRGVPSAQMLVVRQSNRWYKGSLNGYKESQRVHGYGYTLRGHE